MTFSRILITSTLVFLFITSAFAQQSEYQQVEKTLNYYLEGGANNNYYQLANAFHRNATMKHIGEGYQETNALSFFSKNMKAGPRQNRINRIKSIDISGSAASAHLEIEYPTFSFHDFMHLLKIDGEWKIVSKIFYRQEKGSTYTSQDTYAGNTSQTNNNTQQQQSNTREDGIPTLEEILSGSVQNDSNNNNRTESPSSKSETIGKWNFALNGVEGQIHMYQQQGRIFNRITYQNGRTFDEELYQSGNRIMVKNSRHGEYYMIRNDNNLDAFTKDGYVTTCRRVR